ncbi:hypothetical protein [Streptomyces erythrochromogenes]|uniref:hypothetical protein n=1 Tax=Streptomyces erythrochromogenes TaxID=285574 RepID=UPI003864F56E|nr:hypothetical protein OG364_01625 [Streptomyces erythrochromogenes]
MIAGGFKRLTPPRPEPVEDWPAARMGAGLFAFPACRWLAGAGTMRGPPAVHPAPGRRVGRDPREVEVEAAVPSVSRRATAEAALARVPEGTSFLESELETLTGFGLDVPSPPVPARGCG